jgi:hypothetical protein
MQISKDDLEDVYDENLGFSKCYTKGGSLVILLSTDYGKGWSTDCYSKKDALQLMMDARIIRFFIDTYDDDCYKTRHVKPMKTFVESLNFKDTEFFIGGLRSLELVLIDKGVKFKIDSYDGAEYVLEYADEDWLVA